MICDLSELLRICSVGYLLLNQKARKAKVIIAVEQNVQTLYERQLCYGVCHGTSFSGPLCCLLPPNRGQCMISISFDSLAASSVVGLSKTMRVQNVCIIRWTELLDEGWFVNVSPTVMRGIFRAQIHCTREAYRELCNENIATQVAFLFHTCVLHSKFTFQHIWLLSFKSTVVGLESLPCSVYII